VGLGCFENGTQARFFSEKDFGDVEQRIDAGDLVDFLADELDGLLVGDDGDAHADGWRSFLLNRWAAAAIFEFAATVLKRTAFSTLAIARTCRTSGAAVVAARWAIIATGKGFGFALSLVAVGTCPGGSEGKTGQEAVQWVVFRIAHAGTL
jgi:hypothetical protein